MEDSRVNKKYTIEVLSIPYEGKQLEADCNNFTVNNYGTEILYINDVHPLLQNESAEISGLKNELDKTVYRFRWGNSGGTRQAVISRKKYLS